MTQNNSLVAEAILPVIGSPAGFDTDAQQTALGMLLEGSRDLEIFASPSLPKVFSRELSCLHPSLFHPSGWSSPILTATMMGVKKDQHSFHQMQGLEPTISWMLS